MYLRDENNLFIDSECSFDLFEGQPCIVIESSGGSSKPRGIERRNPDYNKLLSLIFRRLADTNTRITQVVLDSKRVSGIPVSDRIVRINRPYPVDLRTVEIESFRKMLQLEVSQMHRNPNAGTSGNSQKRIRICLQDSIDLNALEVSIANEASPIGEIYAPGVTVTERNYLMTARVGQGRFRQELLERFSGACPITGIQQDQLLLASHIKPWKVCNNAERLDSMNGILLSALADRLFDKGLVSFSTTGEVLVSRYLSLNDRERCGVHSWHPLKLPDRSDSYLEYHRRAVFDKPIRSNSLLGSG
jgi:hypothetical protein